MWRRSYLLLLLVRFYFALSPSYLHPDENFQGPEVIAGLCTRVHSLYNPAKEVSKASSFHIPHKRPGNGPLPTQFEASFHYGLSMAYP